MRPGGGKAKGSQFERDVAHLCDKWWEVEKNTFWRTVSSGGWEEAGDIAPRYRPNTTKVWWPFVLECKFYRKIDLLSILYPRVIDKSSKKGSNLSLVEKWISQLWEERTKFLRLNQEAKALYCNRLLVFKGNRTPVFVAFCREDYLGQYFESDADSTVLWNNRKDIRLDLPFVLGGRTEQWVIVTWDVFVKWFNKQYIEKVYFDDNGK